MSNLELRQEVAQILSDLTKERAQLLPALWKVAEVMGWIDEARLKAIADVMNLPEAEVYGVASFYALLPQDGRTMVRVCDDIVCRLYGSRTLLEQLEHNPTIAAREWVCLGRCEAAPVALVGLEPVIHATQQQILTRLEEKR